MQLSVESASWDDFRFIVYGWRDGYAGLAFARYVRELLEAVLGKEYNGLSAIIAGVQTGVRVRLS